MEELLENYVNEEVLVLSKTDGKLKCRAGILKEIRNDIIRFANHVKTIENGTYQMIEKCFDVPSNDIKVISNGQKRLNLR